jgi:hypothetical protein
VSRSGTGSSDRGSSDADDKDKHRDHQRKCPTEGTPINRWNAQKIHFYRDAYQDRNYGADRRFLLPKELLKAHIISAAMVAPIRNCGSFDEKRGYGN